MARRQVADRLRRRGVSELPGRGARGAARAADAAGDPRAVARVRARTTTARRGRRRPTSSPSSPAAAASTSARDTVAVRDGDALVALGAPVRGPRTRSSTCHPAARAGHRDVAAGLDARMRPRALGARRAPARRCRSTSTPPTRCCEADGYERALRGVDVRDPARRRAGAARARRPATRSARSCRGATSAPCYEVIDEAFSEWPEPEPRLVRGLGRRSSSAGPGFAPEHCSRSRPRGRRGRRRVRGLLRRGRRLGRPARRRARAPRARARPRAARARVRRDLAPRRPDVRAGHGLAHRRARALRARRDARRARRTTEYVKPL